MRSNDRNFFLKSRFSSNKQIFPGYISGSQTFSA